MCWDTSHADIDKAYALLSSVEWTEILNIDVIRCAWKLNFIDIMIDCVPRKVVGLMLVKFVEEISIISGLKILLRNELVGELWNATSPHFVSQHHYGSS